MKSLNRTLACAVVAAGASVVALGCHKQSSKPAVKPVSMTPTTKPAMKESTPTAVTATPAAPAAQINPKDATHDCTVDSPLFASMPSDATAKPAMMLKKGDKVVVMVPGRKYSQVMTVGGQSGYVLTTSLKPIGG